MTPASVAATHHSTLSRFPVLLAIDDFQALYNLSTYRDPYFKMVKAYHLTLPRTLLEFASGKQSFVCLSFPPSMHVHAHIYIPQARGAVLGALSTQNKAFRAPLELTEALGLTPDVPSNPYVRREPELVEYAQGLRSFPVPEQLTVDEAASLFDVWHNVKALHLSKWLSS